MGATVWYCCQCNEGPHSTTLKPKCDCGHTRCVVYMGYGCDVVEVGYVESDSSYNLAPCTHPAPGIPRPTLFGSFTSPTDSSPSMAGFGNSFTRLTTHLLPNTANCSTLLSAATSATHRSLQPGSLDYSEHRSSIQGPDHNACPQDPEGEVVAIRWNCCVCGGDNSIANDAGCSYCYNHWKCPRCPVVQYTKI